MEMELLNKIIEETNKGYETADFTLENAVIISVPQAVLFLQENLYERILDDNGFDEEDVDEEDEEFIWDSVERETLEMDIWNYTYMDTVRCWIGSDGYLVGLFEDLRNFSLLDYAEWFPDEEDEEDW